MVSTVGPLPALTILHAQIYELAVHSLDLLAPAAARPAGATLLDGGLAALTDAAGALAARVGITSTAGIRTEVRLLGVPLQPGTAGRSAGGASAAGGGAPRAPISREAAGTGRRARRAPCSKLPQGASTR